jgi:site-specific recombinase XerD
MASSSSMPTESGANPAGTGGDQPPRLLERVRRAIRVRHYSRRTEEAYVHWIRRFIVYHDKRHPANMGRAEVVEFLTALATEHRMSASTQNQALSALLFLYRVVLEQDLEPIDALPRGRTPDRVPVVLSTEEVRLVLQEMSGTSWLVASLLYGAGLRLQECLELRVKDLDFDHGEIVVRRGKGRRIGESCCRLHYGSRCGGTSRQ